MLTCPNCHAQLEDGSRFCDFCGTPIPEPSAAVIYCPHCGQQTNEESAFCQECGKPLNDTIFCPDCGEKNNSSTTVCSNCSSKLYDEIFCPDCGTPSYPEAAFCKKCGTSLKPASAADKQESYPNTADNEKHIKKESPSSDSNNKNSKKSFLFAGIGAAVVLLLVAAFVFFGGTGSSSSNNYAMYVKDKEIYYTGFTKNDPLQVTSRLLDDIGYDASDLSENELGSACQLSKDGSLLFFPDRLTYDGFSLYYRNINKPKEEAVKIDSDIYGYSVSDDASSITYLKNDTLYQYNRKKEEKQKVASDVSLYRVSEDGKSILYLNSEDVLYCTIRGGDREKLDSDVSELCYASEDLSAVFYIKEGSLYKKETGKDKIKISSDVETVLKVYESGEVYYIKADTEEISLMDYVYDDKKESDASLTEPQYPSWSDPNYDAKREAYEAAYEEYNAKQQRDYLREYLNEEKMEQTVYTLCYYDNKEETVVSDTFTNSSYSFAKENPVITYTAYDQSDEINIKLSEAENAYEIGSIITDALYSAAERYVAAGSVASSLDLEEAVNFRLSPDGSSLFYLDEIPEGKDYGELYQITVSSSGETGSPTLYDSDVYTGYFYFADNNKPLYFKDYKDSKGELYIGQEKIDYDVNISNINYDKDTGCVTYFIDWSSDKNYGTLKSYSKKESVKIADDVHSYFVIPNGNVLYLYDYSKKYYNGDLYLWNKKGAEKIDDSVVCIIPVY